MWAKQQWTRILLPCLSLPSAGHHHRQSKSCHKPTRATPTLDRLGMLFVVAASRHKKGRGWVRRGRVPQVCNEHWRALAHCSLPTAVLSKCWRGMHKMIHESLTDLAQAGQLWACLSWREAKGGTRKGGKKNQNFYFGSKISQTSVRCSWIARATCIAKV